MLSFISAFLHLILILISHLYLSMMTLNHKLNINFMFGIFSSMKWWNKLALVLNIDVNVNILYY